MTLFSIIIYKEVSLQKSSIVGSDSEPYKASKMQIHTIINKPPIHNTTTNLITGINKSQLTTENIMSSQSAKTVMYTLF